MLTLAAALPGQAAARPAAKFGGMGGVVTDMNGAPQLGAAVALMAPDGRVLRRAYTDEQGAFLLERLLPGIYSLRVSLATFLPVVKENILIEPGVDSFLTINLASLFTALDLLRGRGPLAESDEDWTWVLRSSAALRPILRYTAREEKAASNGSGRGDRPGVFQFSGGGGGRSTGAGSEADFNTSFAIANQLFHNTRVLFSGNVGYERRTPATAFRVVMRRELPGNSPEVSVTLRQIFLPGAFWGRGPGREENMQSLTVAAGDRVKIADAVQLEYGFLYDSISYLERLDSFSPYGRLIYEAGPSSLQLYYTEGAPRMRLPGSDPLRTVAADLAVFPRLTMRDGNPAVQRGRHIEASLQRRFQSGTSAQAGYYRDDISNLALSSLTPDDPPSGDFFPDVFSSHYSFNTGDYRTSGFRAAVRQEFSERLQATFAYSYGGVLAPLRQVLFTHEPNEVRSVIRMQRRHALTAKLGADVPVTRTRVYAAYKWVLGSAITAGDIYDESLGQAEPNLNIVVRQPLPSFVVLPGRLEAMADFRNLLAQGYVPIVTADGKRLLLVQNVRSFRGGFSFNF